MNTKQLFTYLLLVTMVALSPLANSQERSVSHTLKLSDPKKPARVDVSLMNGKIIVEGYKGTQVEIKTTVKDLQKVNGDDWQDRVDTRVDVEINGGSESPKVSTKGLKRVNKASANIDIEEPIEDTIFHPAYASG